MDFSQSGASSVPDTGLSILDFLTHSSLTATLWADVIALILQAWQPRQRTRDSLLKK